MYGLPSAVVPLAARAVGGEIRAQRERLQAAADALLRGDDGQQAALEIEARELGAKAEVALPGPRGLDEIDAIGVRVRERDLERQRAVGHGPERKTVADLALGADHPPAHVDAVARARDRIDVLILAALVDVLVDVDHVASLAHVGLARGRGHERPSGNAAPLDRPGLVAMRDAQLHAALGLRQHGRERAQRVAHADELGRHVQIAVGRGREPQRVAHAWPGHHAGQRQRREQRQGRDRTCNPAHPAPHGSTCQAVRQAHAARPFSADPRHLSMTATRAFASGRFSGMLAEVCDASTRLALWTVPTSAA
jgi:hypothetical protein